MLRYLLQTCRIVLCPLTYIFVTDWNQWKEKSFKKKLLGMIHNAFEPCSINFYRRNLAQLNELFCEYKGGICVKLSYLNDCSLAGSKGILIQIFNPHDIFREINGCVLIILLILICFFPFFFFSLSIVFEWKMSSVKLVKTTRYR